MRKFLAPLITAIAVLAVGAGTGASAAEPISSSQPAGAHPQADNGLARTPPMGYNNWNSTQCKPQFNEAFVKATADLFVSSGLKAAGYTYINLDDCWAEKARAANGDLVPNHARFPAGIKPI